MSRSIFLSAIALFSIGFSSPAFAGDEAIITKGVSIMGDESTTEWTLHQFKTGTAVLEAEEPLMDGCVIFTYKGVDGDLLKGNVFRIRETYTYQRQKGCNPSPKA